VTVGAEKIAFLCFFKQNFPSFVDELIPYRKLLFVRLSMVKMENAGVFAIVSKFTLKTLAAFQVDKLDLPRLVIQFFVLLPCRAISMVPFSLVLSWVTILSTIMSRDELPTSSIFVNRLQL
jgi:hypothetical protein